MTNQSQSIRQKLAAISSKRGVKYTNLETAFLIERQVARLTVDKALSQHLIFKGGFVALSVYHSPRYAVNLDALWIGTNLYILLERVREKAESDLGDWVWFQFETDVKKAQIVHFDIGVGDPIIPEPQEIKTPLILSQIENLSWQVYPIETMIAEKLHALVSHGDQDSRSKDVYDLAVFLPKADPKILHQAVVQCFSSRGTEMPAHVSEHVRKLNTTRLERGWLSAVASISEKMSFKLAFNSLLAELGQMGIRWIEKNPNPTLTNLIHHKV